MRRKSFVELHRRGLIYRDRRLVNWDPKLQTAISDLEVVEGVEVDEEVVEVVVDGPVAVVADASA